MNSQQKLKTGMAALVLAIAFSLNPSANIARGELVTESGFVTFSTSNIEISYHAPYDSGYHSSHPAYLETHKINLLLNKIQNYINYLKKLNKISGKPNIRINYTPNAPIEDDGQNKRLIKINDLGYNNIIQQINKQLVEYNKAEESYLADNADALFAIPDTALSVENFFTRSDIFTNQSNAIPSNEPDTDYAVLDSNTVLTTRPDKNTNRIFKLSLNGKPEDSGIFSDNSKVWFRKLLPSNSKKYLAVIDGTNPVIVNLETKATKAIFQAKDNVSLLDYEWSPTQDLLAGLILDEKTNERYAFIYDPMSESMLDIGKFSKKIEANYLYAKPYWAPTGKRLAFLSAGGVHLIDIEKQEAKANLVNVEHEIGEFIWSDDAKSFALIEIRGQTRNLNLFDDLDFKGSVLHRYNISNDNLSASEDYAQHIESRNTLKIVSFTDKGQIMYLEGRLVSNEIPSVSWDLSKNFKAYLTPLPNQKSAKPKPQVLPMQYLFVYRGLENKNTTVYDSGACHTNLLYCDEFYNTWILGLYRQPGIDAYENVYNLRPAPYPFPEHNFILFCGRNKNEAEALLKFLQDYNLRNMDTDSEGTQIYFHANFSGVLNIWTCEIKKLFNWLKDGGLKNSINLENEQTEEALQDQEEASESSLLSDL